MMAGEALQGAAAAALAAIDGLGIYEGAPVQAAFPYAMVEVGPEADWSHKSGEGREVRLALVLRDKGERPARLRLLVAEGETAIGALDAEMGGWRVVSLRFVRSRMAREPGGWSALSEYRARMLRL